MAALDAIESVLSNICLKVMPVGSAVEGLIGL